MSSIYRKVIAASIGVAWQEPLDHLSIHRFFHLGWRSAGRTLHESLECESILGTSGWPIWRRLLSLSDRKSGFEHLNRFLKHRQCMTVSHMMSCEEPRMYPWYSLLSKMPHLDLMPTCASANVSICSPSPSELRPESPSNLTTLWSYLPQQRLVRYAHLVWQASRERRPSSV